MDFFPVTKSVFNSGSQVDGRFIDALQKQKG